MAALLDDLTHHTPGVMVVLAASASGSTDKINLQVSQINIIEEFKLVGNLPLKGSFLVLCSLIL